MPERTGVLPEPGCQDQPCGIYGGSDQEWEGFYSHQSGCHGSSGPYPWPTLTVLLCPQKQRSSGFGRSGLSFLHLSPAVVSSMGARDSQKQTIKRLFISTEILQC